MKYDKKRTVCAAVAAVLLAALTAFAFLTPSVAADPLYGDMPPALFGGQRQLTLNAESLAYYRGMAVTREDGTVCAAVVSAREESGTGNTAYAVTLDARYAVGFIYRDITPAAYEQAEELGLLHPLLDSGTAAAPTAAVDANAPGCGYLLDETGEPLLYVPSAHGALRRVRVFYADWYAYQNGRAPIFLLGTDSAGNDVASGIAAALKMGLAAALCVAVAAFAAGWAYGALFGRVGRTVGRLLDAAACLGAAIFAALCARYLPSRLGEEAALLCALAGVGWLWAALRCRRTQGQKWRVALACAVQATSVAVLLGTALTGCGLFAAPDFGALLAGSVGSAPHALWLPAVFLALLISALALAGIALQPKASA